MFVKNLILLGFASLDQISYGYRVSNNAVGINPQNTTMAPNLLWTLPREQGVREHTLTPETLAMVTDLLNPESLLVKEFNQTMEEPPTWYNRSIPSKPTPSLVCCKRFLLLFEVKQLQRQTHYKIPHQKYQY